MDQRRAIGVVRFPAATADGKLRSAFVAGPDRVEIEIVEGHVQ